MILIADLIIDASELKPQVTRPRREHYKPELRQTRNNLLNFGSIVRYY